MYATAHLLVYYTLSQGFYVIWIVSSCELKPLLLSLLFCGPVHDRPPESNSIVSYSQSGF